MPRTATSLVRFSEASIREASRWEGAANSPHPAGPNHQGLRLGAARSCKDRGAATDTLVLKVFDRNHGQQRQEHQ
jgi:hypothetical protein